ncbi:molecular chaperone DnaK [Candidatus Bathyarchaeota archaeon]|nr:molecular chaperone DnaK [Candidatus Bathyarchaeota archaeon]
MNEEAKKKEKIIGIDLGTSNSAAAVLIAGKPQIIPAAEGTTVGGGKAFPSYVAFTKDGNRLVGEPARRQAISNPERTITAIKRKMGTNYTVDIDGKSYTPQEISAMILSKIRQDTEDYLNEKIEKAVITVPAYFNDAQRTATKDAGKIAGLDVVRIINEPTAAALAFGLDKVDEELKIVVLDLGGGTFDVTIMEMGEGVFKVISTSGDTQLGGTDMDRLITEDLAMEFKRKENIDLLEEPTAKRRLTEAAEKAKIELSTLYSTQINLPFIAQDEAGPKHIDMEYTRSRMEEVISPVLARLDRPMEQALEDAKLSKTDINKIILIGGPTRMPCVRERFENFFGKKAERGVDPMEAVAVGAAIQGAVLAGDVKDILLLDVTPLTLGLETLGGVMTPLIDRNTTIPVRKKKTFSTAADNQPSAEIHVLQGERPMADDNISLGKFFIDGIPPAPRGIPQIEVIFEIDANGILQVTAKDLGTGRDKSIRIEGTKKLDENQIEKMREEAEKHKEEDEKLKELIQKRNELDGMAYQAEKMMKDNPDKLDDALKDKLLKGIEHARDVIKNNPNDGAAIDKAKQELEGSLHELAQKIYAQGGAPPGGPGAAPGGAPGGMGGGMDEMIRRAQQAASMGGSQAQQPPGASSKDSDDKKEAKKRVVDVEWEDE